MNLFSLVVIAVIYLSYSFFSTYSEFVPSLLIYLQTKPSHSQPNQKRTNSLEQLVTAPTLGQFFYEELISDYAMLHQWSKVLNSTSSALEWSIN
jgi:hypothetical protein